jgi:hypothetical protein
MTNEWNGPTTWWNGRREPLCECNDLACERQHLNILQRIVRLESIVFETTVVNQENGIIGRINALYTKLGLEYSHSQLGFANIGFGVGLQPPLCFLEYVVFSQRPRGR